MVSKSFLNYNFQTAANANKTGTTQTRFIVLVCFVASGGKESDLR
jgi:hypothetical protein